MVTVISIQKKQTQDGKNKPYFSVTIGEGANNPLVTPKTTTVQIWSEIKDGVPNPNFLAAERGELKVGTQLPGVCEQRVVTPYTIPTPEGDRIVDKYTVYVPVERESPMFDAQMRLAFSAAKRELVESTTIQATQKQSAPAASLQF